MAKKPSDPDQPEKKKPTFKYVGIPSDLWEQVKEFAEQDDRTIPGVVKRALKAYFKTHKPGQSADE